MCNIIGGKYPACAFDEEVLLYKKRSLRRISSGNKHSWGDFSIPQ